MNKIRIGIVGYGNIGRGVELAIERNDDMELVAVVTRRNPEDVNILTEGVKKVHLDDVLSLKGEVDVMILCGGSATDLPVMGPQIAKNFNIIDSFDDTRKDSGILCKCRCSSKRGKSYWDYLCWLGSGNVFAEPYLRRVYFSTGKHLHILGKRCKSGTF